MGLMAGVVSSARASTVYVDQDANGTANGNSWSNAYTSLAIALNQAQPGDEIWVAEGTYLPGSSGRYSTFALKGSMKLYGGFNGTETSLSERNPTANPTILEGDLLGNDSGTLSYTNNTRSDNVYSVVTIDNVDNTLVDGFIIQGGNANSSIKGGERYGAGVYITGINAGDGEINATVRNCTIRYCTAVYSCAVAARQYASSSGDAINVIYENLIVHDNQAEGGVFGEAINTYTNNVYCIVANCLIYNNTSVAGYLAVMAAQVTGSVESYWVNNTIVNNFMPSGTPAIGLGKYNSGATAKAYFYNNLFHNNGGGHEFDQHSGLAYLPDVFAFHNNMVENPNYSAATNYSGNLQAVPDFVDESNKNFRLQPCSPGINDGDTVFVQGSQVDISFDFSGMMDADGSVRYFAGQVDMGAFEQSFDTSVTKSGTLLEATLKGSNVTYQWFDCNTGLALAGETDDSLIVTVNGSYYVEITVDACLTASSGCKDVNNVGLADYASSVAIQIYPKPVTNRLYIASSQHIEEITIMDMQGKVLLKSGHYADCIDVSSFKPGIYFIAIKSGAETIVDRFSRLK